MKKETISDVRFYLIKGLFFLLLILTTIFIYHPKKVYVIKKDVNGYRLTINGYLERPKYNCYCGYSLSFSSIDELKNNFLNHDFTLHELHHLNRDLPEDNNGDKILIDLDNLYQPTYNGKVIDHMIDYALRTNHFYYDLKLDDFDGKTYCFFDVIKDQEINSYLESCLSDIQSDDIEPDIATFTNNNKKYFVYTYNEDESDYIKYRLYILNENICFRFYLEYTGEKASAPTAEYFKSFDFVHLA